MLRLGMPKSCDGEAIIEVCGSITGDEELMDGVEDFFAESRKYAPEVRFRSRTT